MVTTQDILQYGATLQQQRQQLENIQKETQGAKLQFSRQQLNVSSPLQRQAVVPQFEAAKEQALTEIEGGLKQQQQAEQEYAPIRADYDRRVAEYERQLRIQEERAERQRNKPKPKTQPQLSQENIEALQKDIEKRGYVEPALKQALGIEIDEPMTVRTTIIEPTRITTGLSATPKIDWKKYLVDVSKSLIVLPKVIGPPQIDLLSTMANLPSPQQVYASKLTTKSFENIPVLKTISRFEQTVASQGRSSVGTIASGVLSDFKGGTKAFSGIVTDKIIKPAVMLIPETGRRNIVRGGDIVMGVSRIGGEFAYQNSIIKPTVDFMKSATPPQELLSNLLINKPISTEYTVDKKYIDKTRGSKYYTEGFTNVFDPGTFTVSPGTTFAGGEKLYKPVQENVPFFTVIEKGYRADIAAGGREEGRTKWFVEKLGEGYGQATKGLAESYFQAKKGKVVSPWIATKQPNYQFLPESRIIGGVGRAVGQAQLYFVPVVGKTLLAAPFGEALGRRELGSYIIKHPIETAVTATVFATPIIKYAREPVVERGWIKEPTIDRKYQLQVFEKTNVAGEKGKWYANVLTKTETSSGKYYTYVQPRYKLWLSKLSGKELTPSQVLKLSPKQLKTAGIFLKIKEYAPKTKFIASNEPFPIKKPNYMATEYGKKIKNVYEVEFTKGKDVYTIQATTDSRKVLGQYQIKTVEGKSMFFKTEEGVQLKPVNIMRTIKQGRVLTAQELIEGKYPKSADLFVNTKKIGSIETPEFKLIGEELSAVPIKAGKIKFIGGAQDLITKDYINAKGLVKIYKPRFTEITTYDFAPSNIMKAKLSPTVIPKTPSNAQGLKYLAEFMGDKKAVMFPPKQISAPQIFRILPNTGLKANLPPSTLSVTKTKNLQMFEGTTIQIPKSVFKDIKTIPVMFPVIKTALPSVIIKTSQSIFPDILIAGKVLMLDQVKINQTPKPFIKTGLDSQLDIKSVEDIFIPKPITPYQSPSLVPDQIQRQEQIQVPQLIQPQPQIPRPIVPTPTGPKPPTPSKPPIPPVPTIPFIPLRLTPPKKTIVKKKEIGKSLKYIPYVKKKGRYIPVGLPTGLEQAKQRGTSVLRTTLAASLQIRTTGGKKIPIATENQIFRPGNKGRDIFTLVQKRGARLGTRAETSALVLSRRKGGFKFI